MSAAKPRKSEGTFHIQYPARRDFWTWIELGCLARALGYPADLIRQNVTDEVHVEEGGMHLQQLYAMIELKLLNQALHRSYNMHTSDWNTCVIRKAAKLLNISVLSFEEVHNIRIAYAMYEASDMKGLYLDQRTLLRTLKMCHRVISPKKLLHRVKHMKGRLEETNRIQLYEFFDLILWCDSIEQHRDSHKVEQAEGKEQDLYQLVDWESLLSHQDQRQARALDQRYLEEEWDFGKEQLGSKHMFKGEVVYTDQRVKQTRIQKKNYRGLKRAVSQSQRQVYRALAGSIRQRPISAPDLSMYSSPRDASRARTTSAAAVYQSVQRRLHSAISPRASSKMDRSDRPSLPEHVRAYTPSVVTSNDLDEAQLKMQMLQFDISTLETRCEEKKKDEMSFYIPEYKAPAPQDPPGPQETGEKRKVEHWTPDIINNLAYPPYHKPRYHAHTCDARFRGWKPAEHQGRQRILTAPTYDRSPKGQLLATQRAMMLAPVTNMHKDYVLRYTSRKEAAEQQKNKRPCTAPPASPRTKPLKRLGECRSAGPLSSTNSRPEQGLTSCDNPGERCGGEADFAEETTLREDMMIDHDEESAGTSALRSYPDPHGKYSALGHERARERSSGSKEERDHGKDSGPLKGSAGKAAGPSSSSSSSSGGVAPTIHKGSGTIQAASSSSKVGGVDGSEDRTVTAGVSSSSSSASKNVAPPRRLTGSKVVDMGMMGTVTLLESIQEHEGEDITTTPISSTPSTPTPSSPSPHHHHQANTRNPETILLDQSSQSIPAGWSRQPQSPGDPYPNPNNTGSLKPSKLNPAGVASFWKEVPAPDLLPGGRSERLEAGEDSGRGAVAEGIVGGGVGGRGGERRPSSRADSSSSTLSGSTDPRQAPIPLTSVTVTVKNRNQQQHQQHHHQHHVTTTTTTHVNGDVIKGGGERGESGNVPSPLGFKRSPPCITSTPRQRRTPTSPKTSTPTTTPKGTTATTTTTNNTTPKSRNQNLRKNSSSYQQSTLPGLPSSPSPPQLRSNKNKNNNNDPPAVGNNNNTNRPDSGLGGRKTPSLLPQETDPDGRLSWVQNQIQAMNSTSRNTPPREENEENDEDEGKRRQSRNDDYTENISGYGEHFENEDYAREEEEEEGDREAIRERRRRTIQFAKERQKSFLRKQEEEYKQSLAQRQSSEGALKPNSQELNFENARMDLDSQNATRCVFNRDTTRRLLRRVNNIISPELKTRIRTGDTGLRV